MRIETNNRTAEHILVTLFILPSLFFARPETVRWSTQFMR